VDLSQYTPLNDKKTIRSHLGINDGYLIGYCGRFSREKCPEMFIEIADHFRDTKGIQFLMTGAGPLTQEIKSQIGKLNLIGKIHFLGTVQDIKPYLGVCDTLLLPSKIDGRPTAVLQALAMGVPVIASDVGALPKIINNGRNGFLCSAGNVNQFIANIKLLVSDPGLQLKCSQGARQYAEDELDINKWLGEIESLIEGLIPLREKMSF
jgi:O-antigen biosynthesis protein